MSCSTIQAIWPGEKHENIREFSNSWGTAPIVWGHFSEVHLRKDKHWWLLRAGTECSLLWGAWGNPRIPESHRAVLLFTLDHIYVPKCDYARFAKDLRAYLSDVKLSANYVNHWPLIAQMFESDPGWPALGIWCTSVVGDPYLGEYDEEKDEYAPFDWSKAHSLYAELDAIKIPEANGTELASADPVPSDPSSVCHRK